MDRTKTGESTTRARDRTNLLFWFSVWGGTSVAGSVSGFLVACSMVGGMGVGFLESVAIAFYGAMVGGLLTSVFGALAIANVAIVTWCFWLSRLRLALGSIAGGLSGFLATLMYSLDHPPWVETCGISALAGCLGTIGGGLGGHLYGWAKARDRLAQASRQYRWHFTLRDLFIRVTVISALLAVYVLVGSLIEMARQNAQRAARQEAQRFCFASLNQIGVSLRSYHDTHGVLPPAYVADQDGRPLLSWRVLVGDYHSSDFWGEMDLSQPWDSQTNSRFLNDLGTVQWRCPSSEVAEPAMTHYVAVVGPGTLWDDNGPNRLSESEKRILVIEWPDSDIHWAEPRDITLDQLLAWLKSKPETNHPECLLYVDGSGEVGELPIDSDPETVRRLVMGEPDPPPTPKTTLDPN